MDLVELAPSQADIVDGRSPGGANTSHTIAVDLLTRLLAGVPQTGSLDDYLTAAVEGNLLGRATVEGRRRAVRYLREVYLLDSRRVLFRALRDLWAEDPAAHAQLAGLSAYARDSVFRASGGAVLPLLPGSSVLSDDLTTAVTVAFPGAYNESTAGKVGRNTASSWTQTGHLVGRTKKVRTKIEATLPAAAYALLIGHLEGSRGQALYDTSWTCFLDTSPHDMASLADGAGRRGYLEVRNAGGVVEIGFRHLLRRQNGG